MNTFAQGQQLAQRSICNHDCIFTGEVIKRTAKTVTIKTMGDTKRCKIHIDQDGGEYCFPRDQYSMAPIFRA